MTCALIDIDMLLAAGLTPGIAIQFAVSYLTRLAGSLVTATVLTAFYFVPEDLPRFIGAPTLLLLAPVAIIAGLCFVDG